MKYFNSKKRFIAFICLFVVMFCVDYATQPLRNKASQISVEEVSTYRRFYTFWEQYRSCAWFEIDRDSRQIKLYDDYSSRDYTVVYDYPESEMGAWSRIKLIESVHDGLLFCVFYGGIFANSDGVYINAHADQYPLWTGRTTTTYGSGAWYVEDARI